MAVVRQQLAFNYMRTCKFIGCLLILTAVLSTPFQAQQKTNWQIVERFVYDWNGRGKTTFILGKGPSDNAFSRVRIEVPGEREFTIVDKDGFDVAIGTQAWTPLRLQELSKNLIPSNKVLMLPIGSVDDRRTAVFLIGYAYASSPGSLWVITLGEKGAPKVAYHWNEMGLRDFSDLNDDGYNEIVGYPCLSEEFGNYLVSYDPLKVFTLAPGEHHYSLELSKNYNLKHYVWAVPECSEKFAVLELPGRKLQVFPMKEAERKDAEARKRLGPNPKRGLQ